MAKRNRFPPEAETAPDMKAPRAPSGGRSSGPAPKNKREGAEAPTLPPPPKSKRGEKPADPKTSGVQSRRSRESKGPRAAVDEVTADLSKDPRRERD